jgi:hypothetical protein
MYYNIVLGAEKYFYFIKKIINRGDGDGPRMPEPVGDEDEIRFLITIGYG